MIMIDAKGFVSSTARTIGERTLEAGQARVQTISNVYATDVDDLWDAVTSADRIPRWFMPISGDLSVGGRYQLEGNAGGTVTSCDKPRGFTATWEFNGEVSWIEVRISDAGDGRSRLELEHVAHVNDEFWEMYGPGATGVGWDLGFFGLGNYLSDPSSSLDPAAAEAWSLSDDGKGALRLSADAWADAHIAAGGDEKAARESADRTYAFYTGA
jgi:uncharacterized protein YndB with AHSA1/START domain